MPLNKVKKDTSRRREFGFGLGFEEWTSSGQLRRLERSIQTDRVNEKMTQIDIDCASRCPAGNRVAVRIIG